MILSGLLGALSWTLMATLVDSKYGAAFCILLGSLSVAFSDVVSVFYFAFISLFLSKYFFSDARCAFYGDQNLGWHHNNSLFT